jgi:hypothetical protein
MKKTLLSILFISVFALVSISAQDLDEILDNYFETIGQENLMDVQALVSTGMVLQMGQEMPFKFISKRPDKAYIEVDFQGTKMKQAYDGENGWAIMPWTGSAEPVDVTGPDLKGLKTMGDMDGALWDYEKKGHTCELMEPEELDGAEVFVLKLTKEDGDIEYYYMDAENYVVLKVKTKSIVNGSEVEVEALMSNFQEVDGYISPFTTIQKFNGQTGMTINVENIATDEDVDDSIFEKPVVPAAPESEE